MGKLIQFPVTRIRRRRNAGLTFDAFGEMQLVERAQLKLLAACTGGATLVMLALQLAVR